MVARLRGLALSGPSEALQQLHFFLAALQSRVGRGVAPSPSVAAAVVVSRAFRRSLPVQFTSWLVDI